MKKNIKVIIPIVIIAVVCLVILFLYFMPFMKTITMDVAVQKGVAVDGGNGWDGVQGSVAYIKLLPVFPKFLIVNASKDDVTYSIKVPIKGNVVVTLIHETNFADEVKEDMKNNPKETEMDAEDNVAKKHNIKLDVVFGNLKSGNVYFGEYVDISVLKQGDFIAINREIATGNLSIFKEVP